MAYEHVNPEVELKVKEEDLEITEEFIEPNGNIIARETGRTYYEANNMKLESDVGEKDRNETQEKFECCLCEFSTIWIGNFRSHVNIVHFNKKDFKCRLCDYISSYSNTVLQHMSDVHFKLKKFQCHLCEYSTSRKTNLKRHITTVHLNLKKFKCEECAYATNLSSSLKYHIQKVHSDTETYPKPRNYKCNVCELSTTSKKDLNKHIKSVHLKIKDYQCDICEYKASRKTHLKSHMENIHSTKKCKLCDFSTTEQWTLRRHVKDLHPEKLEEYKFGFWNDSLRYELLTNDLLVVIEPSTSNQTLSEANKFKRSNWVRDIIINRIDENYYKKIINIRDPVEISSLEMRSAFYQAVSRVIPELRNADLIKRQTSNQIMIIVEIKTFISRLEAEKRSEIKEETALGGLVDPSHAKLHVGLHMDQIEAKIKEGPSNSPNVLMEEEQSLAQPEKQGASPGPMAKEMMLKSSDEEKEDEVLHKERDDARKEASKPIGPSQTTGCATKRTRSEDSTPKGKKPKSAKYEASKAARSSGVTGAQASGAYKVQSSGASRAQPSRTPKVPAPGGPTYSQVTAGLKVGIMYKKFPEVILEMDQLKAIKKFLIITPKFQQLHMRPSWLELTCSDKATEGSDLRIAEEAELPHPEILVGYLPDSHDLSTEEILKVVENQNAGLKTSSWRVFLRGPSGPMLEIVISS
ncbi:RE1-silencing transcription factor-like [Harmonia axyridis]|uniref:RE1-silencing transcription factor-like n=1 Tax=Harmonia axyridis TaxID=115357 RepID=UPI001E275D92|nr:RE1-silencing transcription factor-like [Harmonia axyridis]